MVNYMRAAYLDPTVAIVPRKPEEPAPQQVYLAMDEGQPYTVKELCDEFPDASRWTVKDRLDQLVEDGFVQKKKHSKRRVTYWIDL